MRRAPLSRVQYSCLVSLIIVIFVLFMTKISHADTLEGLRARLPTRINGWAADSEDRIFNEKTIFSYINGAGEVYRAYNMQQCLSRRYISPGAPTIVLDIFEMGSSEDAYGVFTHDTDGKMLEIGQDARLRPGWLSFWKYRFFVSIYVEEESAAAEKAVIDLGRQIASGIAVEGTRPRLLSQLPKRGLKSASIRYLHHPIVLNYHFYLSDENILNISSDTDVVLADYQQVNEKARLLLVNYPDHEIAIKSLTSFFNHYLPDANQSGLALLEDGKWAAASIKDQLLAIVLEADSRKLAENLLKPFL
ncbi:hypothetical protein LCGC14_1811420 [marine sediment metagenome]|uniref:Uncharacterized protein n=1 Tax=marine sediment metagenome TaxID=412755 RepID=A0A0F9GLQ1_9ZZZZ